MNQKKSSKSRVNYCLALFLLSVFPIHVFAQSLQSDTTRAAQLLQVATTLTKEEKYQESNEKAWEAAQLFGKHQALNHWYDCIFLLVDNGYFQNDYSQTILFLKEAEEHLPKDSLWWKARLFDNLGYCFDQSGNVDETLFFFEKSLAIWETLEEKNHIIGTYSNLFNNYTKRGDYGKGYGFFQKALMANLAVKDSVEISNNYFNLGLYLKSAHFFEEADSFFIKAYQYYDWQDGYLEFALAETKFNQEAYATALTYLSNAYELADENGITEFHALKAKIYTAQKKYAKAKKYYKKAIDAGKEQFGQHHRALGKIHYHFGDFYKATNQLEDALSHYQKALQTFVPTFKSNNVLENPTIDQSTSEIWLMEAMRAKGDVFFQKFEQTQDTAQLLLAIENYDLALQFIEKIKLEYEENTSKYYLGDYTIPFYEKAIKAVLKLYEITEEKDFQEKAFKIAQRSKAFVLRGILSEKQAMKLGGIPETKIKEIKDLNRQMARLDLAIANATEATKDSLTLVRFDVHQQYKKVKESLKQTYPKYAQLRHDLNPVGVAEIQANLDDSTMVLNYFQGATTLYTFALTKTNFDVFESPISNSFFTQVQHFRRSISDHDFIKDSMRVAEQQYLNSGQKLYDLLLKKPLKKYAATKLKIIPDNVLNHLSFEVLLTKSIDSWLQSDAFLLNGYAISYAYYAKLLTQQSNESLSDRESFAGFGLEYDDYTLTHLEKLDKDSIENPFLPVKFRSTKMGKLPYSDDEILAIAKLTNGQNWVNNQATKSNFLKFSTNSKIVHLATHGYVNFQIPEKSGLIFTKTATDTNHILRLAEIYNLDFSAEMIVLSACNTGFGAVQRSEGVMSLARAFNYAGVPAVVASLWSIPDNSTYQIMQLFYQNLKDGYAKDVALQKAKLAYLQSDNLSSPSTRLPVFWAATSVVGDTKSINIEGASNSKAWFWILGGALFLLLAVIARKVFYS